MSSSWENFIKRTEGGPPTALLLRALDFVHQHENALELGSGAGNDLRHLVQQKFKRIDAIDREPKAAAFVPEGVTFTATNFEDFKFPTAIYDFVHAHFSLPFISPVHFDKSFQRIVESLRDGGVISAVFFGLEDDWARTRKDTLTFHSREDIEKLFKGFEIQVLKENRQHGTERVGEGKESQVFYVVAEKRKTTK